MTDRAAHGGPQVLAVLDEHGAARLLDPEVPLLPADDLAVLRGEGVFETVRVHRGHPVLLTQHLDRLAGSARRVEISAPPAPAWRALVAAVLATYGTGDGVLRLVCTKGPEHRPAPVAYALVWAVQETTLRRRERGAHAVTLTLGITASARAAAPWLLGGVKSTSYAVNMAAQRAATAAGSEEAVFVSADGEVLESPTASVAWIRNGTLLTPPVETGILAGTTLAAVLELADSLGIPYEVRRSPLAELAAADEAMLLSAVRGIVAILSLDGRPYREPGPGPVTRRLAGAFEATLARL